MVKGENLMSCEKNYPSRLLGRRRFFLNCFVGATYLNVTSVHAQANWPWSPMTWARVDLLIEREFPGVPFISTNNLADQMKTLEPRLLIDVRDIKEYSVSHLEGAIQADSFAKIQTLIEMQPNVKQVVLYCSVGYRSAKYVQQLRQLNKNNVFNLKGSLFAWANEGKPLFAGKVKVSKVHPFDTKWGELLKPELRAPI
jgi:rhodanese-related sulfurtransferase